MPQQRTPNEQKLRQFLALLNSDYTENLCQNGEIQGRARKGREHLVKAIGLLPADHPAYPLVFAAFEELNGILRAEESEDLRQKGIAGLIDRHLPDLVTLIKESQA